MYCYIALLCLLLVQASSVFIQANTAFAAEELPVLVVTDTGYFLLSQDDKGQPTFIKFSNVIVLGKKQTPIVVVPPAPTEFGLVAQTRQWLATVDIAVQGKKSAIAKGLLDVIDSVEDFETLDEMKAALGISLKSAMKDDEQTKSGWKAFGTALFAATEAFMSKGVEKIKTPKDFARALQEVVDGLSK